MKQSYIQQGISFRLFLMTLLIILLTTPSYGQWKINEGFEGGSIPSDWTIYDENDDGEQWMAFQHNYAHSGNWLAMVQCYNNDGDDWLISPQVNITSGDILSFYARAWYGSEDMQVKLSTSGNSINDFDIMLDDITGLSSDYQEYTYNLSSYAGQNVYIAIRWLQDTYSLIIDDFKLGKPQNSDVGMFSIESPGAYYQSGTSIEPSGTVKNFGASEVSTDYYIRCAIKDTLENTVYLDSTLFTTDLSAGESGIVNFPLWTPNQSGSFSILMTTKLPNDGDLTNDTLSTVTEIVEHFGTGGPDDMSYCWIDSKVAGGPVYDWIDISSTGSSAIMHGVNAFAGDDNFSEPIPIGFDFPFYGMNRDSMFVDINGEILLTDNQWYEPFPDNGWDNDGNSFNYHLPIPGYTEMPALISVFWDDLFAEEGTGDIYYQTFGTSPSQYCVIQWHNLRFLAGNGGNQTLSFEVILHENGDIIMQYQNVDNGQSGSSIPHILGQSATVAIQNDDATAGLSYLREVVENNQYIGPEPPGNVLENEMAVKFYIGEDNQAPIITHEEPWNTFETSAELTASITDISGILYDTLYYSTATEDFAISHTGFTEPNIYSYQISNLPLGSTISYYFAATDNSSNNNRTVLDSINGHNLSFKILPTTGVNILIAMPGNRPGFQDYNNTELPKFEQALNAAGVTYDIFNWAAFEEYSFPDSYDIIFAYANNTSHNSIHDTLSNALMDFLDSGTESNPKNLFVASDNMASSQHALPNARPFKKLVTAYLRAGYGVMPDGLAGPDSIGYYTGSIKGMANSPIGTFGNELPVYADGPDVIYNRDCPDWYAEDVTNPEISSWGSYTFEDGPFNGHAYSYESGCAIWLDNLIYKSYLISFDISQLSNDNDINTMIQEALDWFTINTYTITLEASPESGGNVTGQGNFPGGSLITVTAIPNEGYDFVQWTENDTLVSTFESYTFEVQSDRYLIAEFALKDCNISLTANPPEGGVLSGDGLYYYNDLVEINASVNKGYNFLSWTENDTLVSNDTSYSFVVTDDRNFKANFAIVDYVISAVPDPLDGGTITGAGTYSYNSTATLSAIAAEGYDFVKWTENGSEISTNPEISFLVSCDRELVAHFALQEFNISTSVDPQESGTTSGEGTYLFNEQATLFALPAYGYNFENWQENNDVVSTDAEYAFIVNCDRDLVAHFSPQSFTVELNSEPAEGGTTNGSGLYLFNETATITANAAANYIFENWTEDEVIISTEQQFSFNVTQNHIITAHFKFIEGVSMNQKLASYIYPNPTHDKIYINFSNTEPENNKVIIQLINPQGKQLLRTTKNMTDSKIEVDIMNIKAGVYFLLLQWDNNQNTHLITIK